MRQDLLVLDRKHTSLEAASGRLTIRIANQRPTTLALAPLERIIVATPVTLGSQVLNHLTTHQVAVVFLPSSYKHQACWVLPHTHGHHERRLQQYQLLSNPSTQLEIACQLVRHKLLGQKRNLQKWLPSFTNHTTEINRSIKRLNTSLNELKTVTNLASLLGIEGAAAQAYFQALAGFLAPSYNFTGRNRRPPKDPINAVLSLSYTLTQNEAEAALTAYGLDTGLGFLHAPAYGRASLGCDLVEIARPLIDFWVINLFTQRILRVDQFKYKDEACTLGKAGRQHYFTAWASQRHTIKKLFHRYLRQALKGLNHG